MFEELRCKSLGIEGAYTPYGHLSLKVQNDEFDNNALIGNSMLGF